MELAMGYQGGVDPTYVGMNRAPPSYRSGIPSVDPTYVGMNRHYRAMSRLSHRVDPTYVGMNRDKLLLQCR